MKLHSYGASYDRSPWFLANTHKSEITGKFRKQIYQMFCYVAIASNLVRNLKHRDLLESE